MPPLEIDRESVAIAALFLDLTKVNFYTTEKRNRKNEQGQWEAYDKYTIKEKFCFGGHGSKPVFIAQSFIRLKPEEAVALNCTWVAGMGNKDVGNAETIPLWQNLCAYVLPVFPNKDSAGRRPCK